MIRTIGQCILIPILHLWQRWYGNKHPIRNNQVMLYVHRRRGIVCNPKYILEELMKNSSYKVYWISQYPESVPGDDRYEVVRYRGLRYFKLFVQTKVFVTNDMLDELLYKREGQVILGTWHGGGAYKRVGFPTAGSRYQRYIYNLYYSRIDYMLSDSELNTMVHKADLEIPAARSLEYGFPRNDIFYGEHPEIWEKVRKFFHLAEDTKILLYAPTYRKEREQFHKYLTVEELEAVLKETEKKFGGKWICIYRFHYFLKQDKIRGNEYILNGCGYDDMQELLYCAQVYMTDYSAGMWDFSLMGRPLFLYMPDRENYEENDRGFFIPVSKWPYPNAASVKELLENIRNFDEGQYKRKLEEHHREFRMKEGGNASKKTVDFIRQVCFEGVQEDKRQVGRWRKI